jgi:hypothetical protein
MRIIAAPHEHSVITSGPQEVLKNNQTQPAPVAKQEKVNTQITNNNPS